MDQAGNPSAHLGFERHPRHSPALIPSLIRLNQFVCLARQQAKRKTLCAVDQFVRGEANQFEIAVDYDS
jgi:hypothetical protein